MGRKASLKAKEKLEAVLNDPNRNDCSGIKDRYMSTRDPTSGGNNLVNQVTRRQSQSSQDSQHGKFRTTLKSWWGPPAY